MIVGDDADLILMALVSCHHPNMMVANASLHDGRLTASTPIFDVARLHEDWAKRLLLQPVVNEQVRL